MYDIVLIGGGAAGLFGAVRADKLGLNAAVIEKNERVGKKLLATGNGRCNLTNLDADISAYNNTFPSAALSRYPVSRVIDEFRRSGLITRLSDRLVYPYSMLASSVLDALRASLGQTDVFTETKADKITKSNGCYEIIASNRTIRARTVVLCSGSRASGGTDSSGLYAEYGHTAVECRPSLTQMPCSPSFVKGLNGIRHRVRASIRCGSEYAAECGEMLFKQNALSGIVSFNLSALLARTKESSGSVAIDFYPDFSEEALIEIIKSGAFKFSAHKNIIELITAHSDATPADIAKTAKNYRVKVTASNDYALAQAVSGGLNTNEFNPLTMESKLVKNLYAAGEALNVDGKCGGYNLHWAWISALSAVDAAAERIKG